MKRSDINPPVKPPTVVTVSKTRATAQSILWALRKTSMAENDVTMIRNRLVVAAL